MASFLLSIYTCDVDALPTESLAHRYWTKFGSDHDNSIDYVRCLRQHRLTLVACYNHTMPYCGRRFGQRSPARLAECNRLLWSDKYRSRFGDDETRRLFELYRQCSADLRSQVFISPSRSCTAYTFDKVEEPVRYLTIHLSVCLSDLTHVFFAVRPLAR